MPGISLNEKRAVVIGGTSGIGRAIAEGLAAAGADVAAASRRTAEVEATATAIEKLGRRSLRLTADVTSRASLEALRDACLKAWDHVDILVNCAGRTQRTPTVDVPETEWNSILDTNLTGTLRACQIFGRPMLARGAGSIINICSLASFVGLFEVAAYNASKAAVASLTKTLAVEWAPRGVRVNGIAPGVIPTPLNRALIEGSARGNEFLMRTPMRRFGKAEELAGAAVYLASDAASFVTGEILCVDGGLLASGVNQ